MIKNIMAYLLGMISMLVLMLIGDYFFDESSRDFDELKKSFYAGQRLHQNMIENRIRIETIVQADDISDERKVSMLSELWGIDNTAMLGQMIMYINTNDHISPVYQIDMSASESALKKWVLMLGNEDTKAIDTSNKLK